MKKYARKDSNQDEIVKRLIELEFSVQSLASIGNGCPDIICGFDGQNFLFEIKDGNKVPSKRRLTKDEAKWHENWKGQVNIIESVDDLNKFVIDNI